MSFSGISLVCQRGERPVFAGLDFKIGPGDALLLTGPNGSGKSSLLRLMAGLLQPAGGEMRWENHNILADIAAHRARVAYLGHLDAIKPALTPLEDLMFWLRYRQADDSVHRLRQRARDALDWAGLRQLADLPCRVLSAGQRRRLALARLAADDAASGGPPLWLLDEPTTGLDTAAAKALTARLAAHRAQAGLVVAATHVPLDLPGAATLDLAPFFRRRVESVRSAAGELVGDHAVTV